MGRLGGALSLPKGGAKTALSIRFSECDLRTGEENDYRRNKIERLSAVPSPRGGLEWGYSSWIATNGRQDGTNRDAT